MAVSPKLEILAINEAQANKAVAINTAILQLESALAGTYTLDTATAVSAGFDVSLPFNDANDLSDRTALRFIYLVLAAGAAADFDVIHPDNQHMFVCRNNSGFAATIKCAGDVGVTIADGDIKLLYCDGLNIMDITGAITGAGSVTQAADFDVAFFGTPTADQIVARFYISRTVTFPGNFSGSSGVVTTPPDAPRTFTLKQDGAALGAVAVGSDGSLTFTTVGGTSKIVSAGALLELQAPPIVDTVLTDLLLSFQGTINVPQ